MSDENKIVLSVISLSEALEEYLRKNLVKDDSGTRIELNTHTALKLLGQIEEIENNFLLTGMKSIPIICRPDLRLYFKRFIEKKFPRFQVISYLEVSPDYKIDPIYTLYK